MLSKLITKLTIFALRSKKLSGEQKAKVTGELLKNIQALPYKDIIKYGPNGSISMINGKKLDYDTAVLFIESCKALQDNFARKIIQDQVLYAATKIGVHEGLTPDSIVFSKAAIWNMNEENILIAELIN